MSWKSIRTVGAALGLLLLLTAASYAGGHLTITEKMTSSGATFTTVVGNANNTVAGSWSAPQQLSDLFQQLIVTVASFNLRQGIANSLDAKQSNAQKAFESARSGSTASACGMLGAFINEVQDQSDKALTVAQATELIGWRFTPNTQEE
jgi:hypothetical protein